MIHDVVKAVAGSLATLIIAATAPCSSCGGEPAFLLSKDHDSVFRLKATTFSAYFHLGKDGTYRRVTQHCGGKSNGDRGTWKQDVTGQIEVRSSIDAKMEVESGPLRISVGDTQELGALYALEKDIDTFLAADMRDSYLPDEIEGTWKSVDVQDGVGKVTRKQLVELLNAWKAYLKHDAKNRSHFVTVRYGKFVLLASCDAPSFGEYAKAPQVVMHIADLSKRQVPSGSPPLLVYVLVDSGGALQQ